MRKQHETLTVGALYAFARIHGDARRLEPFSEAELRLYLENSISMARSAGAKSRGVIGRLSGLFFGDADMAYVELDGIAMIQLADMLPEKPDEVLNKNNYYRLPLPVACELYERAFHGEVKNKVAGTGDIKSPVQNDENVKFAEKSKPPSMIWFCIFWMIELYSLYRFLGGFHGETETGGVGFHPFRWDADVIFFSFLLWVSFGLLVLMLYRPSEIMDETVTIGSVVMAGLPIAVFLIVTYLVVFGG